MCCVRYGAFYSTVLVHGFKCAPLRGLRLTTARYVVGKSHALGYPVPLLVAQQLSLHFGHNNNDSTTRHCRTLRATGLISDDLVRKYVGIDVQRLGEIIDVESTMTIVLNLP